MAIRDMQIRMVKLGEIRIGQRVPTGKMGRDGQPTVRPAKLDTFRLTSPSKPLLEHVAGLYGGQVGPWQPPNGAPSEWEVITEADRLPVLVPPQAVSQFYELYKGAKCVRRCDSVIEQKTDAPCMCDPEKRDCSPTTRLNVMLEHVPGIGLWLLTTRGYYAAMELPAMAELLARAAGHVSGFLVIEQRQVVKDSGDKLLFAVPCLEIPLSPAQLLSGASAAPTPVVQASPVGGELPAGLPEDIQNSIGLATTLEEIRALWGREKEAGRLSASVQAAMTARADKIREKGALDDVDVRSVTVVGEPEAEGADQLWQQIVFSAPDEWTTEKLSEHFVEHTKVHPSEASAETMREYLQVLRDC